MSDVQRMRLLTAVAQVASERGLADTTVAHIVARAGVSRRTFYDLFEDRRECFLAAFDEAVSQVSLAALAAFEHEGRWVDRIRGGLFAVLVFLDQEPELARLCVVEALAGGPVVLARRAEVLGLLAAAIDEGRGEARGKEPPPLTAEGLVGAVLGVIHARLLEPAPQLTGLLGSLMGMIVLPYLGAPAAQRELVRAAPERPVAPPVSTRLSRDPLDGLDMRLTYRTLRVLAVIDAHPAISNRDVADHAGITDQGQVSRLLTRLENLGLIHNTGQGHSKGAPNAWHLSPRGVEVRQATSIRPG